MNQLANVEKSAKTLQRALNTASNKRLLRTCNINLEPTRTSEETRKYERRLKLRWRREFEEEMKKKEEQRKKGEEKEKEKEKERREEKGGEQPIDEDALLYPDNE